jgi:hypothetical protein
MAVIASVTSSGTYVCVCVCVCVHTGEHFPINFLNVWASDSGKCSQMEIFSLIMTHAHLGLEENYIYATEYTFLILT